jgi:hypothetical protein
MAKGSRFHQATDHPEIIFQRRRFLGIALEPPDYRPGSWVGAGKATYREETGEIVLTARPRVAEGGVRGYAANIFRSKDGLSFELVQSIAKEEAASLSDLALHSIEGTQLLWNPEKERWHLYLSVDTGEGFVWGGVKWETLLLTATSLEGPWRSEGVVLANDREYDAAQARDATIDIVDGAWVALYKAKDLERRERPALATSSDGIIFRKAGPLTIDGSDHLGFLSGTLFPGDRGPVFMGLETQLSDSRGRAEGVVYADEHGIGHGGGPPSSFVAYRLGIRQRNLATLFRAEWVPLSDYEHPEHPLLGYSSLVSLPGEVVMIYVEAIDPKHSRAIGLNETVERLLVYGSSLA